MKKILVPLLVVFAAISSFAGVVQPVGTGVQIVIPAAGSAPGANGTFFRSDISLINLSGHAQTVAVQWLPMGSTSTVTRIIDMPASTGLRPSSGDFVAEVLNQSGLGAIVITGLTGPGGTIDPTARLYVNARIWTPQPGTGGTTSQSFPAIPMGTIDTPAAAFFGVGGVEKPENYRVNIGIVNLDPNNAQTFFVFIPTQVIPVGQTVTVPAMSMQQISMGDAVSPTAQINVQNTTPTASGRSNLWTAYASTVNNITGDAWSELAVTATSP